MATAGRILLMHKGEYQASVTYEMLDMVSYEGVTWVAKKTCLGITPSSSNSEYWFDMIGVSSENFEAFKNEVLASVESTINASISEAISESEDATDTKINAVDSKVTTVDNRVTAVDSRVTTVDGRVTTVNNSLSKYVPLAGGNMTGALKAVNPSLNVEGIRNITAGTADLTAGSSALATGAIYIVYE